MDHDGHHYTVFYQYVWLNIYELIVGTLRKALQSFLKSCALKFAGSVLVKTNYVLVQAI